jgi:hypothetical protein
MYVNRTHGQNLSVKMVASMIAAIGGKAIRVRGAGFKEQKRWALPAEDFDPGQYQKASKEAGRG